MKRLMFVLILLLAFSMTLVNAQSDADFVIGINAEPNPLDPHHAAGAIVNNRGYHMIFDQLVRVDSNGVLQPMLATEWENTDDTTWVFTLREGVVFHDGSVMTAEDVAFSLNRLLFGENESFIRSTFLPFFEAVEATGELEVTITTPNTDPLLPLRLATPYSAIMPQAYVKATGFEAVQTAPVGAGPYRVTEAIAGERLVLERHDDYWMGAADAATITMRIIPELSTRISALQAGEVDFITTVSPDLVENLSNTDGVRVDSINVNNFMLLYFNTNTGLTADPLFREALSLAIDREAIAEGLWNGEVRVMNDYLLPNELGYDVDREIFAYNPERALELLEETGYNGEVLEFTPPNAYYTNGQLVTDAIAEMWTAIGINVDYQPLDTGAWAERSLAGENIVTLQSFGTNGDPATSSIVQTWDSWMGAYYTPSDEFRALASEAASSLDDDMRVANYRQIIDILDTEVPFTPLYQTVEFYAMRDGISWEPHQNFFIDVRPGAFSLGE
jgi:peptide/nickel transport system substrate-binding protein